LSFILSPARALDKSINKKCFSISGFTVIFIETFVGLWFGASFSFA
jgi:hypothetical protein